MTIGILSDSHDNLPAIRQAVEFFNHEGADLVVHAGDFVAPFAVKELLKLRAPVIAVFGNNDGEKVGIRAALPQVAEPPLVTEIEGKKTVVTHDLAGTVNRIPEDADVVVHGHTHKSEIRRDGDQLIINPGEVGGWLAGRRTVAVLDPSTLDCRIVELE